MNPNKELLQAIIDGKTVQYQYVNPPEDCHALHGAWIDLVPDLAGSFNYGALHQMMCGEVHLNTKFIFRIVG